MHTLTRLTALSLGAAALLCNVPAQATLADYQTAVTNEFSLISFYTFDQGNANDSLGLHNGTTNGGVIFAAGIAEDSLAMVLDGTGRASLGIVPDFDFSDTTGSVEAWVQVGWSGSSPGYNPCLFADRDGGPVRWSLHMNGDKGGIGVWNGSAYSTVPLAAPGTKWHHLVVVFDNGITEIFWDGLSLGTFGCPLLGSGSSTQIGSSAADQTNEGWIGAFDEVAFYADALPASTVQAHYAAFFAGTPPVIIAQPRSGNFLPGVQLQLKVGATGPSLTYQWSKNGSAISGATDSTLTFFSLAAGDAGTYNVLVHNPAGDVTSSNAVITLTDTLPPQLVQYQAAVLAEPSLVGYYSFDRLNADTSIGYYVGTLTGTADFGQGVEGGPDQGLLLDGAGSVALGSVPDFDFPDGTGTVEAWVRADWPDSFNSYNPCLFADRDGGLVAWSVHMNADKRGLGVYNGSVYLPQSISDAGSDWHHVAIVFDAGTNTIYWDGLPVRAVEQPFPPFASSSTQLGSSGWIQIAEPWIGLLDEVALYADALPASAIHDHYKALLGDAAPQITVQPVGGAFYTGQPFTMGVGATGADRTYQWSKDSIAISGATNWNLVFASLTPADSGTYSVAVSNSGGTTNSVEVALLVGNNLAQYQAAVENEPSLISYYTFDASDFADQKGPNDGSAVGTVNFAQGVGLGADQAILLDGTGHVALGQVPDFEFTNGQGTVEAWIRADWTADPGYAPTLFSDRVASLGRVDWSVHMGPFRNIIGNWNGAFFQTAGLPGVSDWHHFAITFGGDRVAMYWDGLPLGSFAQPIDQDIGLSAQIGSSDPVTTTEGWIGGIDEVAFYSTTLGPEAIYNHFFAMVGPGTQPSLTITRAGNQVILSWPTDVVGYTLEYATSLTAVSWTPVDGVVNNSVTLPIETGSRFFRLRK